MGQLLSFDTETTGLRLHYGDQMFAFSVADDTLRPQVYRLDGSAVRELKADWMLKGLWKPDAGNTFIMHNSKFDMTATEKQLGHRIAETARFHDTFLQSHIVQNNHPNHRLKELAWELAHIPKDDEAAVSAFVPEEGDYSMVPEHIMRRYQELDAQRTMLLHLFFYPMIKKNPLWFAEYQMELDLIPTTMRMEARGVMLRPDRCKELIMRLSLDADKVLGQITDFAGDERINPESPDQLRWLLYKRAGLPILNRTEKTKVPSTDKETLMALRENYPHPILDLVMKYRSWLRGAGMLQSYLDLADSDNILHPDIRTCGAKTSREACRNPNLQNVAKAGVLLNPFPIPAREAFRPRPGYVNFHLDYSGIEMRLLIHYCKEPELVAVCRSGGDIHLPACETFYLDRWAQASKKERESLRGAGKNMNFGIPYGAAGAKVAAGLGLLLEEGLAAHNRYCLRFPKLVALNKEIADFVRANGFVDTTFGRRLKMPRSKAYAGLNALIQGTAAGILKRAQPRVHRYLEESTGGEAGLLLPIHDELVLEFPRKRLVDAPEIIRGVRERMIDFHEFNIPLDVDVKVATLDWAHKVKYPLGN